MATFSRNNPTEPRVERRRDFVIRKGPRSPTAGLVDCFDYTRACGRFDNT
jgi:hypothetical protein